MSDQFKIDNINIGSLNIRGGMNDIEKKKSIMKDLDSYDLQILSLQETKTKGSSIETIKTKKGRYFEFFQATSKTNKHYGTALLIESSLLPQFTEISDRLCMATIKIENRKLIVIAAYAPTEQRSITHPDDIEKFYSELEQIIDKIPNRDLLVITGDFNARVGKKTESSQEVVGRYAKGDKTSTNGQHLIEICYRNDLILLNTIYKHKMSHRTTWTSNLTPKFPRKNPYRNQIDFIIIRKKHLTQAQDARSYGGITTSTDHKLVKASFKLTWYKVKYHKPERKPQTGKLRDKDIGQAYKEKANELLKEYSKKDETPQDKWTRICQACHEAAETTIPKPDKRGNFDIKEIEELSSKQKKLKNDIESTSDENRRKTLKKERKTIQKEIRSILQQKEKEKLDAQLEFIEQVKDDSQKMFQAIKEINKQSGKRKLLVDGEEGQTSNPKQQVKIVTSFFKDQFNKDAEKIQEIPPTEMKIPFTPTEVTEAIKKLKYNKSPGMDNIRAEHLKNGPILEISAEISEILNETAKTGIYPEEIKLGQLTPLQKPGKKAGPPANLRPIILLSLLRKILAIIMIKRISEKILTRIPKTQAAYQTGRSTTEHIFAIKILAEMATTTANYTFHLLMLDMSKAFDTVNRKTLFEILSEILDPDELHIMKILTENVKLRVKIEEEFGEEITTDTGVPQGDCMSALLFILYLAQALKPEETQEDHEHDYSNLHKHKITKDKISIEQNYTYSQPPNPTSVRKESLTLEGQYADDMFTITTSIEEKERQKRVLPPQLKKFNLLINESKTEEYNISSESNEDWKKCKLLGSLLDTEQDIKRRKGQAMNAYKKKENIFKSSKISLTSKIRVFNAYITPIFLYNCELWTLTKNREKTVDTFQRNLLRKIMNIKWPRIITNDKLMSKTKQTNWSDSIKMKRLSWYGHVSRLDEETPAQTALKHIRTNSNMKKLRGGQKSTWIKNLEKDLNNLKLYPEENINELTQDRPAWRKRCKQMLC